LDRDWVEAGTRRTAYYSHVPPGRYTFQVIAANSDGVWNTLGSSVRIRVHPRFYQTWWFLSAVALAFAGLGFAVYRIRVNRLEQARRAHEQFSHQLLVSQEQERQRIAAELHDSLGQSLLIIKNRVALAQSDIDQRPIVEEQLQELSHSATAAIDECREIAYNLRPYQISRFGLTKTLYGIFMRINEVTAIQAAAEIEQVDDVFVDEEQINVYRIVQECVNNIIKHSGAAHASLHVERSDAQIALSIEDDGRGFVPLSAERDGRKGGFGLIGIAERVRLLGGRLDINSGDGTGTRISISIPRAK
jgi:signal transduction histidine kinase